MDKDLWTQQEETAQEMNDFFFLDSRRYENHIRSENNADN